MTRTEQRRAIQDLKYYARTMTERDRYDFDMLVKRENDDEDLDVAAVRVLEGLSAKYARHASRSDVEEKWKKLTSKPDRDRS